MNLIRMMVAAGLLLLYGWPQTRRARAARAADVDAAATRAMKAFAVPGIAVGIVKDGHLVFARGYGVRAVGQAAAVDPDTMFAIGSNTKAFTSAALAILVDEGKLRWDDRVIDYLPDFRMWDPYVTREFTIRDVLTHRSGLGLGAGDLMFVTPTDFTRRDIIHGLRYLKPASSFRSQFAYDNLMYAVAGQVVEAASGQSWEDFVTQRIFAPLHMDGCAVSRDRLHGDNVAAPHLAEEGTMHTIPPSGSNRGGAGRLDLLQRQRHGEVGRNATGGESVAQTSGEPDTLYRLLGRGRGARKGVEGRRVRAGCKQACEQQPGKHQAEGGGQQLRCMQVAVICWLRYSSIDVWGNWATTLCLPCWCPGGTFSRACSRPS